MTNPNDQPAHPSLRDDDPRISEWIDGRLSPAEAAEVEQAMLRSPALARLVADLRALKQAARQVVAVTPPAGFAERVMEVIRSGGTETVTAATQADRAVEQEWRQLETERIADERAEAEVDRAEAADQRIELARSSASQGWPWLTVVAALAAGLLVAVVLNRPDGSPREVARVMPEVEQEKAVATRKASPPAAEAEKTLAVVAEPGRPALRQSAATNDPQAVALPPGEQADRMADAVQVEPADRARPIEEKLGQAERGTALARNAEREATAAASAPPAAALARSRAEGAAAPPLPVVVTVGSWTEFDRLLEAHGVEAKPIDDRADEAGADKAGAYNLELSGPPAGLEALLAAAGVTRADGRRLVAGEEAARAADVADGKPARQAGGQPPQRTALVRLVIQEPIAKGGAEADGAASPPATDAGGGP